MERTGQVKETSERNMWIELCSNDKEGKGNITRVDVRAFH